MKTTSVMEYEMQPCCGGSHDHLSDAHGRHEGGHMSNAKYQCPMKCEGDKTYDRPGNCPVCNMKLMPVGAGHMHA